MKPHYQMLINDLLENYNFRVAGINSASAVAEEIKAKSVEGYQLDLYVGVQMLEGVAHNAGDYETESELSILAEEIALEKIPKPACIEPDSIQTMWR